MKEWHEQTALELGDAINTGKIDPRDLTRYFLDRAAAADNRGTVFVRLTEARALSEADAAAFRARSSTRRSRLDGVPLSWKDLFDTAGIPTEGGSKLLEGRIPAKDAEVVRRLTNAGTVCLGKTSMTEFAYSGLGVNPTCGTPYNSYDPDTPRVPGGSSAGAGTSVALGLAPAAIGTDTGGSVRIPAAWSGLVGLKPTAGSVPNDGVLPLSYRLDTVGPLTKDLADAVEIFALLSGQKTPEITHMSPGRVRFGIMRNDIVWSQVDDLYRPVYERVLEVLKSKLEGRAEDFTSTAVDAFFEMDPGGGHAVAAEAFAAWGEAIEAEPDKVFHEIAARILPGRHVPAWQMIQVDRRLPEIQRQFLSEMDGIDAVILPTVGFVPPSIESLLEDSDAYQAANIAALTNTLIANQLGLCSLTLPVGMTAPGPDHPPMPVGLMLFGAPFAEAKLLALGNVIMGLLAGMAT